MAHRECARQVPLVGMLQDTDEIADERVADGIHDWRRSVAELKIRKRWGEKRKKKWKKKQY
jgi:hypothetical protein